jgi:hypothetical protein
MSGPARQLADHSFVPGAYFKSACKLAKPANTIGCFKYAYKSEPGSYLVSIYCANLLSVIYHQHMLQMILQLLNIILHLSQV